MCKSKDYIIKGCATVRGPKFYKVSVIQKRIGVATPIFLLVWLETNKAIRDLLARLIQYRCSWRRRCLQCQEDCTLRWMKLAGTSHLDKGSLCASLVPYSELLQYSSLMRLLLMSTMSRCYILWYRGPLLIFSYIKLPRSFVKDHSPEHGRWNFRPCMSYIKWLKNCVF